MQGQLFLVQLKPISIRMCVHCTMWGLEEDMAMADVAESWETVRWSKNRLVNRTHATVSTQPRFVCYGKSLYYITCDAFVVSWQAAHSRNDKRQPPLWKSTNSHPPPYPRPLQLPIPTSAMCCWSNFMLPFSKLLRGTGPVLFPHFPRLRNEKLLAWKSDYVGKKLYVSGYLSAVAC